MLSLGFSGCLGVPLLHSVSSRQERSSYLDTGCTSSADVPVTQTAEVEVGSGGVWRPCRALPDMDARLLPQV